MSVFIFLASRVRDGLGDRHAFFHYKVLVHYFKKQHLRFLALREIIVRDED
jgi:hypothetical protein